MAYSTSKPVGSPDNVSLLNHTHNFTLYSAGSGPGSSVSLGTVPAGRYSGLVLAQWHRSSDRNKGFSTEALSVSIGGHSKTMRGGWGKTGDTGHGYDFLCTGSFGFANLWMNGGVTASVGSSHNCTVVEVTAFLFRVE